MSKAISRALLQDPSLTALMQRQLTGSAERGRLALPERHSEEMGSALNAVAYPGYRFAHPGYLAERHGVPYR